MITSTEVRSATVLSDTQTRSFRYINIMMRNKSNFWHVGSMPVKSSLFSRKLFVVLMAMALTACGGSSSDNVDSTNIVEPLTVEPSEVALTSEDDTSNQEPEAPATVPSQEIPERPAEEPVTVVLPEEQTAGLPAEVPITVIPSEIAPEETPEPSIEEPVSVTPPEQAPESSIDEPVSVTPPDEAPEPSIEEPISVIPPEQAPVQPPEQPIAEAPFELPEGEPARIQRPDVFADEERAIVEALEMVKDHISETNTLSADSLVLLQSAISENLSAFANSTYLVQLGFDVIEQYDERHGALFTNGSDTDGGISSRTASGNELEHLMLELMQGIFDVAYTEANLKENLPFYNRRKFETSSFFPGPVDVAPSEYTTCNIKVNGTHVRGFGIPANYETGDARRPTGCYLAPGSISRVTVPDSMIGIGASVLVGAHTWDLAKKPRIARMDRVSKQYDITENTVTIGNPLGGGIYINIPYEQDLGILDIKIENVVRSPYFANTVANKTTAEEWQNQERSHPAPFADFESDKVMMQVPTSWIYAMEDPSSMMDDWDLSMDAISELFARPLIRPKTVVYSQVDVISRGGANFPGYPQSNIAYNPDTDYGGDHNNFLVKGPRGSSGYLPSVFYHELGHAENIHKFNGEVEAYVNFLWVAVHNKKFGVELNEAFRTSRSSLNHTIEEAAQSWMIAENFRNGKPMSRTAGQFRQEFAYQPRGYAKYADIVRLFGWEALEKANLTLNEEYENGIRYPYRVSNVPWDIRSLRLSIAAGYDLTPLFHFWGIHPVNADSLRASILENNLPASAAIYDQLLAYKDIVLPDNEAFRNFGLKSFRENAILNHTNNFDHKPLSYYEGFLNAWWFEYDAATAQATEDQVQTIIDLYFPDGRPAE